MKHSIKVIAANCLDSLGIIDYRINHQPAVKILMLHQVNRANNPLGLSILPELFEELVVFLNTRYEIISLADAVDCLNCNTTPSGCVLTFDDGYRDNYDFAFPILKKHNVPATIFVTLDALDSGVFGWDLFDQAVMKTNSESLDLQTFGLAMYQLAGADRSALIRDLHKILKTLPDVQKRQVVDHVITKYGYSNSKLRTMLTWDEAREMANSGLVTIGAHTITHPILSRIDKNQARLEIIEGKSLIEKNLGMPVQFFAYPNGSNDDFNDEHIAMVKEAGYTAACSTIPGDNCDNSELFSLRRIDITTRMCTDSSSKFSPSLLQAHLSGLFLRGAK